VFPATLDLGGWRWLSWREASAQLVERIERNLHNVAKVPESQHAHCP
jgi:alpha-1,2-rhamnosyltransferase